MTTPVLQRSLPHAPWMKPETWRLPGIRPIPLEDWLIEDDAFAAQMALREELITTRPGDVHGIMERAHDAAQECLDLVLGALADKPTYAVSADTVTRPDGARVAIDRENPLITLGRLQQADICLMQDGPEGHVLTGGILCFPAHWTLAEKLGRSLPAIHTPVTEYTADAAKRVQRLFDALRVDQILCRSNALLYETPDLFTPKSEQAPPVRRSLGNAQFIRSERQTLRRLPRTQAVVFTIHTFMVDVNDLTQDQRQTLPNIQKDSEA